MIRRVLFAVLALTASLLVTSVSQAPPAAATHVCYVEFYTTFSYTEYATQYACPTHLSVENTYWPLGWPQEGAVSSMIVRLQPGFCAYPFDNLGWRFGPLYGNTNGGHWDIADLRPYGWNDRITGVTIKKTSGYC